MFAASWGTKQSRDNPRRNEPEIIGDFPGNNETACLHYIRFRIQNTAPPPCNGGRSLDDVKHREPYLPPLFSDSRQSRYCAGAVCLSASAATSRGRLGHVRRACQMVLLRLDGRLKTIGVAEERGQRAKGRKEAGRREREEENRIGRRRSCRRSLRRTPCGSHPLPLIRQPPRRRRRRGGCVKDGTSKLVGARLPPSLPPTPTAFRRLIR